MAKINDNRIGKVTKKIKDKKPALIELTKIVDIRNAEIIDESGVDSKFQDKKGLQGVMIDGKTYTCATCKTGHRVGVCKHARERPMKATHPPGRPPAGAPKKIICDCPKNCSCAKRDCKCARNCNCTQTMFMLVYVPAPDEKEYSEEERGSWKLGEKVITDLKGNILSREQIEARQKQKKVHVTESPSRSRSRSTSTMSVVDPVSPSAAKPTASGGCCKHKQTVTQQNIAAQAAPSTATIYKPSADGCNCGTACACAFCPQHPNNSTSLNVARQQAMHFANQAFMHDSSIVPFLPDAPQGISCMGGQPRFAMSTNSLRPSFAELQQAFPNPGYVIGYPIWPMRTDHQQIPVMQFHMGIEAPVPFMGGMNITPINMLSPSPETSGHDAVPQTGGSMFNCSENEFNIGNAFVSTAGTGVWDLNLTSSATWSIPMGQTPSLATNLEDHLASTDSSHNPGNPEASFMHVNHQTTQPFPYDPDLIDLLTDSQAGQLTEILPTVDPHSFLPELTPPSTAFQTGGDPISTSYAHLFSPPTVQTRFDQRS